jgi:hypothetical protein
VNLLGFLVRGLVSDPNLDELKNNNNEFIQNEIATNEKINMRMNIIGFIVTVVFFFILFHFWNIGVVFASIIIMAGRLPDLLNEIKQGKKINQINVKKTALYYISAFLPWLALPLLYYSLFH